MKRKCFILAVALVLVGSAVAEAQGKTKIEALCGGNPALAVMTSDLLQARLAVQEGKAARAAMQQYAPQAVRDGKLQCTIGATAITEELLQACASAKLEVVGTYAYPGLNQVVVRCSNPMQLDAIAARSDVRGIAAEPPAMTSVGSVYNQADASINADDARTIYGVDGTGVRVGVLSDSFIDIRLGPGLIAGGSVTGSSDQLTGDLPASVRLLDAGPGGGSDEGNAMAQLIYDLAPGCDLSIASAFSGYAAFASNITALHTDPGFECDVIVDDVYYFAEPMYQNGPIAIAANAAAASGVPYFSSAGNQRDDGHERPYLDVNTSVDDNVTWPPTGVDFHDFGVAYGLPTDTHLEVAMVTGDVLSVILHWDQPYGGVWGGGAGSEADLDLYITSNLATPLTSPGNVLASGTVIQGSTGAPLQDAVEWASYQLTGANTSVFIVVDHYDGVPVNLHLWVYLQGAGAIIDKPKLADRTVFGHAAAENAMAVAAVFYGEIDTGGTLQGGAGLDVEPFSSLGGDLPFYFDDSGAPVATTTRFKPEITGPDGTNTTFFGNDIGYDLDSDPNFYGTSAAAPHLAAVAALMLEASSTLTPAQVYNRLRSTAVDAETAGADYWAGDGVADASGAVAAAVTTRVSDWKQY